MALERARALNLVDFLVALCAVFTLVTRTPVGELASRTGRWAIGARQHQTPLFAFFETAGGGAPPLLAALPQATEQLVIASRLAGSDAALVMAFALANGGTGKGGAELSLNEAGRALLVSRGVAPEALSTPRTRFEAVARELPRLADELGSPEAALCALVLGMEEVKFAVARARADRFAPDLDGLLPHLPGPSRALARGIVGPTLALATAFGLAWPVAGKAPITSGFGFRHNPVNGNQQMHGGLDLGVPEGTEIRATADGVVIRAGEDGINGRFLVIDHGRGVTSAYCHNSALLVSRGQKVKSGEAISQSGQTGRATGPHLHYQVELSGQPIDPSMLRDVSEKVRLTASR